MATLINSDNTKVFYGASAARDAYTAAEEGATIILSEGEFENLNIEGKMVKIYGAGMNDDLESGSKKTSLNIYIGTGWYYDEYGKGYSAYPKNMHIEGLYCDDIHVAKDISETPAILEGLTIKKCHIGPIGNRSIYYKLNIEPETSQLNIRQCFINQVELWGWNNDVSINNCYIENLDSRSSITTHNLIDHCILKSVGGYGYYTNNIFLDDDLPADSEAYNNIFTYTNGIPSTSVGENNWTNIAVNGIFTDEDGEYDVDRKFTLKFPKLYVGTDGTEVGINGGVTPWNPIPSIPRIVSSEIDNRTDTDGIINVNITVEAQNRP